MKSKQDKIYAEVAAIVKATADDESNLNAELEEAARRIVELRAANKALRTNLKQWDGHHRRAKGEACQVCHGSGHVANRFCPHCGGQGVEI